MIRPDYLEALGDLGYNEQEASCLYLVRTRLLILDFVLAHPGLEYLETEAERVAYFRELAVPEALIPGRVYKGIDPKSTTKRRFVDRFPVFFSAESDCPPGELTPTFV